MDVGVIFSFILRILGVIVTVAGAFGLFWKLVKSRKLRAWRIKRGVRMRIRKRAREAFRKQGVLSASRGGKDAVAQAEKAAMGVFEEVGKDSQALAQAWLNRETFTAHVNDHAGAERRAALNEGARSLFDELLDIVVGGLCRLAETATDAPGAVKAGDEANAGRHVETTKRIEALKDLIKKYSPPRNADRGRKVRFGSLPAQAAGFVDRREQADLYEALTKPEPADSAGKRETSQLALDDPQARGSNADNNADHSTDGAGGGSSAAGDGVGSSSDGAGRAADGSGSSTNGVGSSAVGGPVVVCGMRGVGKSQLAAAYARECERAGWPLVAWMGASSRNELVAGLAELAVEMGIDEDGGEAAPEILAGRCVTRLNSGEGDRLLVFDNVDDFDDLTGLVPHGQGLRVLVTTTVASPGDSAGRLIAVGTFTRDDSIHFVIERTGLDDDGAARLAEALGDLPVALAQAAATIRLNGYATIDEYLADLRKYRLEEVVDRASGEAYPSAVHAALRMAYTSVLDKLDTQRIEDDTDQDGPARQSAACVQLAALALLAPSGVPRPWLHRVGNSEPIARHTLGALVAHSVCALSEDGRYVRIHGLQGRVLREDYMRQPEVFADLEGAVVDLLKGIDMDKADTDDAQRTDALDMADQLRAIAEQQQGQAHHSPHEARINLSNVVDIVNDTIWDLTGMGRPQTALTLEDAIDMLIDALGPDHPDTLGTRSNLALAHHAAGHLSTAIDMFEALLADHTRVLVPDDPDTLTTRSNLALAHHAAGHLSTTIDMFEALLADRTRVLGPDHPDTLLARNNLALAHHAAGHLSTAIDMHEALLTDMTRLLSPDHPDTLRTRNNLATAHQESGSLQKAIDMHEALLADCTRVLGPDHPRTLTARNNLADAHQAAGNLPKAIDMFEDLLPDMTRVLGPDHPHTLIARNNLATAHQAAGNLPKAIDMYQAVLADCTRLLGPDHPDTLTTRSNLATAHHAAGHLSTAIDMHEALLTDMTRLLSPDHPDTLRTRNNLATAHQESGSLQKAIDMHEALLADCTRVLGPDHPRTLTARNNLADAHQAAGNLPKAIDMFEDLLPDMTRVLGPDHPHTLIARNNLATAHQAAGNLPKAIDMYQAVLADCTRLLGPDHPDTLTTRSNLATAHHAAGHLPTTIDMYEAVLADRTRILGPDHPDTLTTRSNLATAHHAAGHLPTTIDMYEAVLADRTRILGPDHPDTLTTRNNLAAARKKA